MDRAIKSRFKWTGLNTCNFLTFFEKNYNDWIKCKLPKSRTKWTGLTFIGLIVKCLTWNRRNIQYFKTLHIWPYTSLLYNHHEYYLWISIVQWLSKVGWSKDWTFFSVEVSWLCNWIFKSSFTQRLGWLTKNISSRTRVSYSKDYSLTGQEHIPYT